MYKNVKVTINLLQLEHIMVSLGYDSEAHDVQLFYVFYDHI